MTIVKVGMISFAHMHAAGYLRALLQRGDVEVVGIADENRERVRPLTEQYGIPYYAEANELLRQSLNAVVICSENSRHAELTVLAANAGKHVLCEKPLGVSEEEMLDMIRVCREQGVQLMTAFPCRFIPAVIEAKQEIEAGAIGDIVAIKGTNRGTMPRGWFIDRSFSGGGAVLDHTVHVMDLMLWFTGSEAAEVYAHAETLFHEVDIDDAGIVHVRFENGIFATLDPSWSRPESFPTWGDVTLEIIGTKGVATIDAFAQKNEIYSDLHGKGQWAYWGDNMDTGLIDGFIAALKEGREVPITGTDGYRSARIALAAYESARTGAPVVIGPASMKERSF
ncbi:MAG TPA: Gfo/Idh/MocA family oxidoreductase [Paenibacillus sp.]|uniref:Gfo/Idh/MocA family protein n=1 Tax=Paenibacillus sp. TaxID=58172 RepID=UPI0028D3D859|nr:Gfo/Idh/MocA family oxidoreductase [Paenibacillus sp.]HUC91486.1 Gfo/Idh/MocA family oxidoreductase [Paenibacillus sp.]